HSAGGSPIAVTWCPLCNSSLVFDRRAAARTLSFGTTGKLRNSDLVMYDRETGELVAAIRRRLHRRNGCRGRAQISAGARRVGRTLPHTISTRARSCAARSRGSGLWSQPYAGYDSADRPFLYRGSLPKGVPPLERVVSVGEEAWTLDLVKKPAAARSRGSRHHLGAGPELTA